MQQLHTDNLIPSGAAPDQPLNAHQEYLWLRQLQDAQDVLWDAIAIGLNALPDLDELLGDLPQLAQAHVFGDEGEIARQTIPAALPIVPADLSDPEAALADHLPESWDLQTEPALRLIHLAAPSGGLLVIIRHRILAETLSFPTILDHLGATESPVLASFFPAAPEPVSPTALDDTAALILHAFREALAAPDLGPDDDFFDHGGHSLIATRIIGRLKSQHGIALRFTDLFHKPTARALALGATQEAAPNLAPQIAAEQPLTEQRRLRAPLSLAQHSLWKAYAAFGYGEIFNIPFGLRFLAEVDEDIFAQAFRDLLIRHPVLRSHFSDESGIPSQEVVPVNALDSYVWFWRSDAVDLDGTQKASRALEAHHRFDLTRELPLRLRFFRDAKGQQELSLLFHHIVLDEWSVNLLLDELGHAYRQRAARLAPIWSSDPPGFHDFAAHQRAADPDKAHLAYWLEHLRDAPVPRALLGTPQTPSPDLAGGWVEIVLSPEEAAGLHGTARRNAASLFNTVYAAIAYASGRLSGREDVVIGTSASGRNNPAFFDTIGYFTTMVAHRTDLSGPLTPARLIAQVRETIAASLPHSDIPLDLVGEAISPSKPLQMTDFFEVFIQIHAQNKMNGAFDLMDGRRIPFRQIDPEKSESILGLQFEVVEDVIEGARHLRIMMSYRADHYGPDEVLQVENAVKAAVARFAQSDGDDRPLS